MTIDELKKLRENLEEELVTIDKELGDIATENPLVRGDFDVKVEDMGQTMEDAAQEAGELDRQQAMVDALERRRKEIVIILNKIKENSYGECENCSADIGRARLQAIPVASLCISCAQKVRF